MPALALAPVDVLVDMLVPVLVPGSMLGALAPEQELSHGYVPRERPGLRAFSR